MALRYKRSPRKGWSDSYASSTDDGMGQSITTPMAEQTPASSSTSALPPAPPADGPPTTTSSSSYGSITSNTAVSEVGQSKGPPTQTSTTSSSAYKTAPNYMPTPSTSSDGGGHRQGYWGGMASGILLAVIVLLFGLLFVCLRRRRRRRQAYLMRENKGEEEGSVSPTSTQRSVTSVTPLRPAVVAQHTASQHHDHTEHPIILSSIDPSRNNTYFTGLDTSDVMSVRSTGTRTTNMEEPPPPYRPRSIAIALSRDSSVRHPVRPNVTGSSAKDENRPPIRSPFADPSDDSMSEISEPSPISEPSQGPSRRRAEDEFSAVSDLSYQREGSAGGSSGRR